MKLRTFLVLILVGGGLYRCQRPPIVVILPNGGQQEAQDPTLKRDWRLDVLSRLGNTHPTDGVLSVMDAWRKAEGGTAAFNWLNTTQRAEGATCYNRVPCVKNYISYEQGINATVETLLSDHPGYDQIVAGLQQNDPQQVIEGIRQSPWGSSADRVAEIYNEIKPVATVQAKDPPNLRSRILAQAMAQVGKGYVLGTSGPDTFDCSGLVQWVYAQEGIDTGRVTQDQLRQLRSIEPSQVQPGDLIYFQFSWDQHTGILADVDGDGKWDMINAGTPDIGVVVTNDIFADPFWTDHIIGYRTAL